MDKYIKYIQAFGNNEQVINWINTKLALHLKNNTENQSEIEHILDYLSYEGTLEKIDIKGLQYENAKKNAEKWMKALSKKGRGIKETPEDTEIIHDFGDGFKIVKLIGKNAYEREGAIMGHCVASYFGNGKEIYSLRDKDNIPHCTMEKDQQIKGRGNGDIHPNYIGYIVTFLEKTGMNVGDSEMKHLGYINIEDILKEEKDLVFPELYKGKYFNEKLLYKVENKDRMSMWSKFSLFNFGKDMEVSFNFDFEKCREFLHKKLIKLQNKKIKDSNNKVAMTYDNKVAMTYDNKVAMTNSNEVAMTDSNEVAMTYDNKVAMTSSNKVAMTSSNKVAMTYDNKVAMTYDNKVAMTDSNEVAMTDSNEVAMTSSNKVAMTDSNKVAMTNSNEVAMTDSNEVAMTDYNVVSGLRNNIVDCEKHNVIVLGNYSKIRGKKGTLIVFYERNDNQEIINHISFIIDGDTVKENTWYSMVDGKLQEISN